MCRTIAHTVFAPFVLIALVCTTSGCATASHAGAGPDRTGGIAIEFFLATADHAAAYYVVHADGTIGYGGAHDARRRRTTWTGEMSDEHIERLKEFLKEHRLLTESPPVVREADHPQYDITIRSEFGRNRVRAQGESPALEQLHSHLRDIATMRFEHILDTLPRPDG